MRCIPCLPLLGVLALAVASCKKVSNDEIRIGEFASLTGSTATFGQSSHNGTLLAIDEIKASGGLLGKKVSLITEDDQSKQGEAAAVVRKLISRDKVIALLGEVASGRSLEAAPIAQENKVPMISPSSTNPRVTEERDYVFRICFTDPFQARVLATFAASKGWKKVAVLTDKKQDYSVGLTEFFTQHFTENGGQIVANQTYQSDDTDFNAQLTSIKSTNPDMIFVSGYYTEAGLIAKQARQLGLNMPMLGGDGWDSPTLIEVGGAAMEGNFFSNHFSIENKDPAIQAFVKRYQDKFGEAPDAMAALGYDSAMILADAIKRAGTTESKPLRDAIAATANYPGITGVITLDENRNATKPAVILTIQDGKFKFVETVKP